MWSPLTRSHCGHKKQVVFMIFFSPLLGWPVSSAFWPLSFCRYRSASHCAADRESRGQSFRNRQVNQNRSSPPARKVRRTLVLLRHGPSVWSKQNMFAGWTDVDLTEEGIREGRQTGFRLAAAGYSFDDFGGGLWADLCRCGELAADDRHTWPDHRLSPTILRRPMVSRFR
jgi:hypothetical protein